MTDLAGSTPVSGRSRSAATASSRRAGVQLGTVDALIAQLCIRHDLTLLTMDGDFAAATKHAELKVWKPAAAPR